MVDPTGGQVSDFFCFSAEDHGEWLSNGRTIDYANKVFFTTGDIALQQPQPADGARSWRTPAAGTTSC